MKNIKALLLSFIAILLAASSAWCAAFTSAQDGNWSDPATWTHGSAVPGDGDVALILGHTVTIDQDIGSPGNGIKNIILSHVNALLQLDSTAPRSILFGSTGSDPVGATAVTDANWTGDDASAFGFFVAAGRLALVGSEANRCTINTASGSNRWYIHHRGGDRGLNVNCSLRLEYCDIKNFGLSTANFTGVHWQYADSNGIYVTNCDFDVFNFALQLYSVSNVTFGNNSGRKNEGDIVYLQNPMTSGGIQNNTFSEPGADAKNLVTAMNGMNNVYVSGNSYTSIDPTKRVGVIAGANTGCIVENNVLENPSNCAATAMTVGANTIIRSNVFRGVRLQSTSDLAGTPIVERNFIYMSQQNISTMHSPMNVNKGSVVTIRNNIIVCDFTSVGVGIFVWDTSDVGGVPQKTDIDSVKIYYNTIVNIAPLSEQFTFVTGIAIGQNGDPAGGVEIVGNIVAGWNKGIVGGDDCDFIAGAVRNNLVYDYNFDAITGTGATNFNNGGVLRTGDPKFFNAGGTTAPDYFITAGGDGVEYGETTYAPDDDFTGELRALTPSIGAYDGIFTTEDPVTPVKGITLRLYDGTTPRTNMSDIAALWWDTNIPSGAPDFEDQNATTNSTGFLTINLNATTSLDVNGTGFLLLYKLDETDYKGSLVFGGRLTVEDIE